MVETAAQKKKRKRQEEKVLAKIKESKDFKRRKRDKEGEPDNDDDDDIAWGMYKKSQPLPGQLENCELCDKRFTVTAYSKTGPAGGLLCTKCSKEQEALKKKDQKPKKQAGSKDKRRETQSKLLDGIVLNGSKSLQDLCIEKVANNIHEVDEFGDLPPSLLHRLSKILSRKRVITPRTLDLFLRPEFDTLNLYDCGKLEVADYIRIFSVVPYIQNLNLRNAGQFKDEVIDYILERNVPLKNVQLEAANLVSDEKWCVLFEKIGDRLESLKLAWLDYSMDDDTLKYLVVSCPNIQRLKLKKCFRLADPALNALTDLKSLQHLSLRFPSPTSAPALASLISSTGANLRTLSLENFTEADDLVLETIHSSCTRLEKFRFTENDYCTDAGFAGLFTNWPNPPLAFIDLSSNRSIDYTQPDGPLDNPTGLASSGFKALMHHSGSRLEALDISSCRHISYETLASVFDGKTQYPNLKEVNISFLTKIDTAVVAGLWRSCPAARKVTAFGCFGIVGVVVPKGVALIGVPDAGESIVREGEGELWA